MQLATADACLVAQISLASSRRASKKGPRRDPIPREQREQADQVRHALVETLASREVIKAGVGIDGDAIDLWSSWGLELNSRLELGGDEREPRRLARLCADATGITLAKPKGVQRSDWAAPLTEEQVAYAAADAWAGVAVYERLLALDAATYTFEAVKAVLASEDEGAQLFALRCARQATRAALAEVARSLDDDGLPHFRGGDAEGRRLSKTAQRRLAELRSRVARSLAASSASRLPVGRVLDRAPVEPSAQP